MEHYSVPCPVVVLDGLRPVYGSYRCGKIAQIETVKLRRSKIILRQGRNLYRIIYKFGKLIVADAFSQAIYGNRGSQHGIIFLYGIGPWLR